MTPIGQEDWPSMKNFPTLPINSGDGCRGSAVGGNSPDTTWPSAEQNNPFMVPRANAESVYRVAQGFRCPAGKRNLFETITIDKTNEPAVRRPERRLYHPYLHQRCGSGGIQRTRPELPFTFDGGDKGQSAPIR